MAGRAKVDCGANLIIRSSPYNRAQFALVPNVIALHRGADDGMSLFRSWCGGEDRDALGPWRDGFASFTNRGRDKRWCIGRKYFGQNEPPAPEGVSNRI